MRRRLRYRGAGRPRRQSRHGLLSASQAMPTAGRAAAALALPLKGVAGFARDPGCFRVRPSEMTSRNARRTEVRL